MHTFSPVLFISGHILIALQQLLVGSMLWYFGHFHSPVHHMLWQIYEGLHLHNHQPVLFHQLFQLAAPGAFLSLSAFSLLVLFAAHKTNGPPMAT